MCIRDSTHTHTHSHTCTCMHIHPQSSSKSLNEMCIHLIALSISIVCWLTTSWLNKHLNHVQCNFSKSQVQLVLTTQCVLERELNGTSLFDTVSLVNCELLRQQVGVAVLVWVHVCMDVDECNIPLLFSQLLSPISVAFMRPQLTLLQSLNLNLRSLEFSIWLTGPYVTVHSLVVNRSSMSYLPHW